MFNDVKDASHNRQTGNRRPDPQAGVTLVEILVVLMIMGLVATVVMINVLPSQNRARVQKAATDIATLEQALELFQLQNARYPTAEEGLETLTGVQQGGTGEAYIRRLPNDPWNRPYQYVVPGERGPYEVFSLGADGQIGGEGLDADIRGS
jgi:general secretion pathway protein G